MVTYKKHFGWSPYFKKNLGHEALVKLDVSMQSFNDFLKHVFQCLLISERIFSWNIGKVLVVVVVVILSLFSVITIKIYNVNYKK